MKISKGGDWNGYKDEVNRNINCLSRVNALPVLSKPLRAQARVYERLRNVSTDYLPEAEIMSALEFRLSDVLVIAFVLLAASILLKEEKDNGMLALSFTTPKGRGRTAPLHRRPRSFAAAPPKRTSAKNPAAALPFRNKNKTMYEIRSGSGRLMAPSPLYLYRYELWLPASLGVGKKPACF